MLLKYKNIAITHDYNYGKIRKKSRPQEDNTVPLSAYWLHGFNVHLSTARKKTRELFWSPVYS